MERGCGAFIETLGSCVFCLSTVPDNSRDTRSNLVLRSLISPLSNEKKVKSCLDSQWRHLFKRKRKLNEMASEDSLKGFFLLGVTSYYSWVSLMLWKEILHDCCCQVENVSMCMLNLWHWSISLKLSKVFEFLGGIVQSKKSYNTPIGPFHTEITHHIGIFTIFHAKLRGQK